tara:strand:+ start:568 stop:846 length:279 start_codon:yes stop_codon:yes gene_type:complete
MEEQEKHLKTHTIGINVNQVEYDFINAFADAYGFRSASDAAYFLTRAMVRGVVSPDMMIMVSLPMELQKRWKENGGKETTDGAIRVPKHCFA